MSADRDGFRGPTPGARSTPGVGGRILVPAAQVVLGQLRNSLQDRRADGLGQAQRAFELEAVIGVLGHLPRGIDIEAASRAGVRSIEHLGPGVPLLGCCSTQHDHVREAALGSRTIKIPGLRIPLLRRGLEKVFGVLLNRLIVNPATMNKPTDIAVLGEALRSFDGARARVLAERFAEDGTWNVPTLIRVKSQYLCQSPEFTDNDELRYVAPKVVESWRSSNKRFAKLPAETRSTLRAAYDRLLELTSILDDAGAPMLAGSDVCGAGWLVPGFALHKEFDEIASAGLSPLRVLQLATSEAGRYLGSPDRIGVIAAGASADLVVLDADPLVDVAHLHRIDSVVRAGRHFDRAALDAILARAEADPPGF